MTGATVLYVDPDESRRAAALEQLRAESDAGEVRPAASVEDATEWVRENPTDCVVTEYDLGDWTGFDLAERVREVRPSVGCVLYTAADRSAFATEEFGNAVAEYVDRDTPNAARRLWDVVEFTATLRAQTAYPVPQNEQERLDALDDYDLDPEALEAEVERITDLTAQHLDTPLASVNIIKEHSQEFLACHGADWTPTHREESICTYAIVDDEDVTVIEDVHEDPRFEHNDELRDLGIRSYAGADLTISEGLTIGTLCAYDEERRTFSDDDRAFLRTLADVTTDLLELHNEVTELRDELADSERDAPEARLGGGRE
ncbi:GAF domain-containing protein [Halorussus lipolyticus]|uniref:GAF domain-containing protein n=1 Tax=Halorussus lipolyticus TaxID=3034024 RepID=UPI0023E7C78B|nr:GAF domain-containing protein [Halorussus sp. DT80]